MTHDADLQRGLGRVEGKLDAVLAKLSANDVEHNDLEERVRKVENKLYYVSGGAAVAGFILSKIDFGSFFFAAKVAGGG